MKRRADRGGIGYVQIVAECGRRRRRRSRGLPGRHAKDGNTTIHTMAHAQQRDSRRQSQSQVEAQVETARLLRTGCGGPLTTSAPLTSPCLLAAAQPPDLQCGSAEAQGRLHRCLSHSCATWDHHQNAHMLLSSLGSMPSFLRALVAI